MCYLCVGFPQTLSAPAIFLALFICLKTRVRCLSRVCVWRPLLFSSVVIWRISTCFLGAINLQGKEKSSSFLTFVLNEFFPAILQGAMPSNISDRYIITKSIVIWLSFSPSSAYSQWLLRGHMTSNDKTFSRQKSLSGQ